MVDKGPVFGLIYDKYGSKWLLAVGGTLHVIGILAASVASEHFYALALSQGVCKSSVFDSRLAISVITSSCAGHDADTGWQSRLCIRRQHDAVPGHICNLDMVFETKSPGARVDVDGEYR